MAREVVVRDRVEDRGRGGGAGRRSGRPERGVSSGSAARDPGPVRGGGGPRRLRGPRVATRRTGSRVAAGSARGGAGLHDRRQLDRAGPARGEEAVDEAPALRIGGRSRRDAEHVEVAVPLEPAHRRGPEQVRGDEASPEDFADEEASASTCRASGPVTPRSPSGPRRRARAASRGCSRPRAPRRRAVGRGAPARELAEAVLCRPDVGERVVDVRVEPGRHDQQVGVEARARARRRARRRRCTRRRRSRRAAAR